MFHDIPPAVLRRMRLLEAKDAADRGDGTPHGQRLRQVPPETGRLLAILAATAPAGRLIEVGASGGYSALWLSLACRVRGDRLTTFEISPDKAALAEATFAEAEVAETVDLIRGDAMALLPDIEGIAFAFLDAERSMLKTCVDCILPRLVTGGLIVADNVISHAHEIGEFLAKVFLDARMDAVIVPVGSGLLLCRKAG